MLSTSAERTCPTLAHTHRWKITPSQSCHGSLRLPSAPTRNPGSNGVRPSLEMHRSSTRKYLSTDDPACWSESGLRAVGDATNRNCYDSAKPETWPLARFLSCAHRSFLVRAETSSNTAIFSNVVPNSWESSLDRYRYLESEPTGRVERYLRRSSCDESNAPFSSCPGGVRLIVNATRWRRYSALPVREESNRGSRSAVGKLGIGALNSMDLLIFRRHVGCG